MQGTHLQKRMDAFGAPAKSQELWPMVESESPLGVWL